MLSSSEIGLSRPECLQCGVNSEGERRLLLRAVSTFFGEQNLDPSAFDHR